MSTLEDKIREQRQEIKSDRMDMSFGEITNMYRDGEIVISPEYQRAFRWDKQRQTDFIESILLGIPFPSIFVAANEDGTWELIDGLQRISTVLSFFGELKESSKESLVLEEGSIIKELQGSSISNLPIALKLSIKRTPCRVEIIQNESNFEMRYELFKRLNTGGEGLTRQEIRNCIFRGSEKYEDFNNILQELSTNSDFRNIVNISKKKENEMYFEELVLRFFSLLNKRQDYKEQSIQDFFDKVMKNESENPDTKSLMYFRTKFMDVFNFLNNLKDGENIFRLARLNFSTSMYDSVVITLAESTIPLKKINQNKFIESVERLKSNQDFNEHAGAASSSPSNIRSKVETAKSELEIDVA